MNSDEDTEQPASDSRASQLQPPPVNTRVGWIYQLKKDALKEEAVKHHLDPSGTVEELRRRLSQYLIGPSRSRSPSPVPTVSVPVAQHAPLKTHRWGLRFNGISDPVAFLERLEEIRDVERIHTDRLLTVLPELLTGSALLWYRNTKRNWRTWQDFVDCFQNFYLPADYENSLEEEISRRHQMPREAAREYIVDMQTLIRRHRNVTLEKELFWIHRNLLPDYRLYIPKHSVSTIPELLDRVKEYEALRKCIPATTVKPAYSHNTTRDERPSDIQATAPAKANHPAPHRPPPAPSPPKRHRPGPSNFNHDRPGPARSDFVSDPTKACWKCGKTGHFRTDCTVSQRVLFCSRCGKKGIYTKDCKCHKSEN